MDIKMETSCNNDVEIVLTPKNTPKYNVGQIIIHSDQEDEVEGESDWLNQFQVALPPKSPNYTSNNETDEHTNSEQESSENSDEHDTSEVCTIIRWNGRLNLNCLNPTTTISGETLQTHGLKNIKTKVNTIETWANDFQIHQLKPAEPTIWIPKSMGTMSILTGPLGIVTCATVKSVSNISNKRRTDKCVIQLSRFEGSRSEDGREIPELDNYNGTIIVEGSQNKWKALVGRRIRAYARPRQLDSIYNRVTSLSGCINPWYTNINLSPLTNCKIINVLHSRNDSRKTNKAAASATNPTTRSFQC